MKALLVSMAGAPATPSYFMPDNGLAQLAACLLEAKHEVEVADLNDLRTMDRLFPAELRAALRPIVERRLAGEALTDAVLTDLAGLERKLEEHHAAEYDRMGAELAARVRRSGARLVGFKLWNGDGWTGSARLARAVRAACDPGVLVVGGGPHVDFFGEALYTLEEAQAFDALSFAEGEPTVLRLMEHLEGRLRLDDVPNLLLPGAGGARRTPLARVEHLGALPLPVYDEAVYPQAGRLRVATHEETRGCPHHCAFCNHPLKAGSKLRERAPRHFVNELLELTRRYGFRGFKLGGSYTGCEYMRRLAEEVLARGTRVPFCGYGRVSDAREADFALYHAAGCEALFFGIETGDQLLLDHKLHKGHKVPDAERVLRASKAAGIYTIASIIYPNPGETGESRAATLKLIERARPDGAPVHFPVLLPGSRWFDEPESYGFTLGDRKAFLRAAARYKALLLFPAAFWTPLPYCIDGKPFAQFAAEADEFAARVEDLDVVTLVSDEAAMLARLAGEDVRTFRDRLRVAFMTGDMAMVEGAIAAINN